MDKLRIEISLLLFAVTMTATAQGMTYNHDPVVMNQFLRAEIGTGTLGAGYFFADQYYKILHGDYRRMANQHVNNKLANRALTYSSVSAEEGYALQIKDSLERRAEIEALNISDRSIDLEWIVEEDKIKRQQAVFMKNIQDIPYCGGTYADKETWTQIYNMVQQSLDAAHAAYMPNSQRKAVYLLLYKDLCTYNTVLGQCKVKWWAARSVRENEGVSQRIYRTRSIINDCYDRWKLAWAGRSGNTGSVSGIDAGKE